MMLQSEQDAHRSSSIYGSSCSRLSLTPSTTHATSSGSIGREESFVSSSRRRSHDCGECVAREPTCPMNTSVAPWGQSSNSLLQFTLSNYCHLAHRHWQ